MRRFLVVASDVLAQAGTVGTTLLEHGDFYDTILPTARHATWSPFDYPGLPDTPGTWDGLIIMGGAMSANEVAEYPFFNDLFELVRRFDAAERPVLGVCLGAQVIARAYGGEVYETGALETGFNPIAVTDEAQDDPLFAGLGPDLMVFQNHYESMRGIKDAVTLARGDLCPVQAFRIGERVYGTQFHVEVTLDGARDWYRVSGAHLYRDAPNMVDDLDTGFIEHFRTQRDACRTLVERWADLAG